MRYFLARAGRGRRFEAVSWFMFLDDDLYIRPHALLGMLDNMATNKSLAQVNTQSSTASSSI